jgi:hypothetical protein
MNMRHERRLSPGMLAGAPAVALVALAAGCTASHAVAQPRFQQMQPAAAQWDGAGYVTILRPGQKIAVHVVAAAGTRWELRIDGTPQRE